MLSRPVTVVLGVAMLMAGTQQAWARDSGGPCVVVDSTGQCAIKAVDPARPGGPKGPKRSKRSGPARPAARPAEVKRPLVVQVPSDGGVLPVPVDPAALAPAPARPPAAGVAPSSLARVVIERLALRPPRIRLSTPADGGLVGVPVWLWSERGPSVTGPVTRTATAGAVSVTATARLERIEWSMGPPGAVVSCAGPGTPWRGQQGRSPDCGYVYEQRSLPARTGGSGRWPITATGVWAVTWSGGGSSGEQTLRLPARTSLAVGEVQVLVDGGGR